MSTKDLDFGNVIKMVYDPPTESLKVLATITIGSIAVDLDASNDSVRLGDGVVLSTFTTIGPKNALDVNIAGGNLAIVVNHTEDSIRLGDGTSFLTSTTVGPKIALDANIVSGNLNIDGSTIATIPYVIENIFNTVSSVPSGISTNILTYTAPVNKYLFFIGVSGENLATFDIKINGIFIDKVRTTYTKFDTVSNLGNGVLELLTGDIVTVNVLHNSASPGEFEAKIQVRSY